MSSKSKSQKVQQKVQKVQKVQSRRVSKSRDTNKSSASEPTGGDGEITITFNPIWLLAALAFIIIAVSLYKCKKDAEEREYHQTSPPTSSTKDFKIETLIARAIKNKSGPELQQGNAQGDALEIFKKASVNLRKNNERSVGEIQNTFKSASRDLKKRENAIGEPAIPKIRKWYAPPGVQPGTLTVPDVGYITNQVSNVDQGFPGLRSSAVYSGPQSFTRTLAVNQDGSVSQTINESFSDNAPNGLMPPYTNKENFIDPIPRNIRSALEHPRVEKEIVNELGITDHSWSSSNNLADGISGETWNGDRTDWGEQKAKMKDAMQKIGSLFDSLLVTKVFANPQFSTIPGGQIQVKTTDGECISLERYYEYVSNTIAAQMGASPQFQMDWARGSKIKLGLENIDASIDDLRKALASSDCGVFYTPQNDRTLLSSSGKKVSFTVIWPQDGSVLLTHEMKTK